MTSAVHQARWTEQCIPASETAALMFVFVLGIFFDYTFVEDSPLGPITAGKLLAGGGILLHITLFRSIHASFILILHGVLLAWCIGACCIIGPFAPIGVPGAILNIVVLCVLSCCVYSCLLASPHNLSLFAAVWCFVAAGTCLLEPLQCLSLIPRFTVPVDAVSEGGTTVGLARGVGLKGDPNDQAMLLCIGLAFTFLMSRPFRMLLRLIFLGGIACTFSRMGAIVAAVTLAAGSLLTAQTIDQRRRSIRTMFAVACVAAAGGIALLAYRATRLVDFTITRFVEVGDGIADLSSIAHVRLKSGGGSASTRAYLMQVTLQLVEDYWASGTGPNGRALLYATSHKSNFVPHNSVLDLALAGGVWGFLATAVLAAIIVLAWRRAGRLQRAGSTEVCHFTRLFLVAFIPNAMLLSLMFTSTGWLLVIVCAVALSCHRRYELASRRSDQSHALAETPDLQLMVPRV